MSDQSAVVASAVILPERMPSPQGLAKRKQSSASESNSKRPRLGKDAGNTRQNTDVASATSERRKSGQLEERKRGQRLFGALLGTLSQSSSSTAQSRRIDIEKKQQAKLKSQADEYDEKKKQRFEALSVVRRQEQKKYNKQSMQIRHSNLLATAQFLHTVAEPKLYYKPWELLPDDNVKLKTQILEAEAVVERERLQYEAGFEKSPPIESDTKSAVEDSRGSNFEASATVGSDTNLARPSPSAEVSDANHNVSFVPEHSSVVVAPASPKDNNDDSGEDVLEADGDMVIY